MQFRKTLNNFINASIKKPSNEIVYEMKLNKTFDIFDVIIQNKINIIDNRDKNRRKATDVFAFAIFNIKTHYDNHYKVVKIKLNDKTNIKLY